MGVWSKIGNVVQKFFSVVFAIVMIILTIAFLACSAHLIHISKNFEKLGFSYFLTIIFSVVVAVGYVALHLVPRKAYRLLYALTGFFLAAAFLMGHSMGTSALTVNDCRIENHLNFSSLIASDVGQLGHIDRVNTTSHGHNQTHNHTVVIGTYGEPVTHCPDNVGIFVCSFFLLILYFIGLFDVQNVLFSRVKSKTYGERFVEMGISN